jgi:hypothetical protein
MSRCISPSKLNQEDTNHLNISIISNDIGAPIEPPTKSPKLDGFIAALDKRFNEELCVLFYLG